MIVEVTMIELRTNDGTHYCYKDGYKWERKQMWKPDWESVTKEMVPTEVQQAVTEMLYG